MIDFILWFFLEWVVKIVVAIFLGFAVSMVIGLTIAFVLELPDLISSLFNKDRKGMTKYTLKQLEKKLKQLEKKENEDDIH